MPKCCLPSHPALAINLEDAVHLPIIRLVIRILRGSASHSSFHSTTIRTVWVTPGMRLLLVKYHWVLPYRAVLPPSCYFVGVLHGIPPLPSTHLAWLSLALI